MTEASGEPPASRRRQRRDGAEWRTSHPLHRRSGDKCGAAAIPRTPPASAGGLVDLERPPKHEPPLPSAASCARKRGLGVKASRPDLAAVLVARAPGRRRNPANLADAPPRTARSKKRPKPRGFERSHGPKKTPGN